ncbi:hypothetical protein R3P38DRAFT_2788458 [Favolaschia claudopus]|uniref:Uncharacterized protein n=1 Tax=Favolaschia claudopus TaxID=2862362 RepID=A0AAW0AMD1_9AGAR
MDKLSCPLLSASRDAGLFALRHEFVGLLGLLHANSQLRDLGARDSVGNERRCSKGLTGEDSSAFYGPGALDSLKKLVRLTAVMGYKAGMTHVVGNLARPGPKIHEKEVWKPPPLSRPRVSHCCWFVSLKAPCGLRKSTVLSRHSSKAAFLGVLKHLCLLVVAFCLFNPALRRGFNPLIAKLAGLISETGDACFSLPTMGIPDYWKIVKPASEVISLKQLAANEGLSEKRRELGSLRVGVVDLWYILPLIWLNRY